MDMRKISTRIALAFARWALVSAWSSTRGMLSWWMKMAEEWIPDPNLTPSELERLKEALGDPHAMVVGEEDIHYTALMASIAAEILVIAREHGCNCKPTIHIYIMDSSEHAMQGGRIEHEPLCIGQMRAHFGDN